MALHCYAPGCAGVVAMLEVSDDEDRPAMSAMKPSDVRLWAKEMVLMAIDKMILNEDLIVEDTEPDEEQALRRERNRVAKMFGLPLLKK